MAKPMSPSEPISAGQAAKFIDIAVAALRKSGLPSAETQQVLETHGAVIADEFVALVRKRVEAISELIIRRVTVDGTRTPQAALDATNRTQYMTAAWSSPCRTVPAARGTSASSSSIATSAMTSWRRSTNSAAWCPILARRWPSTKPIRPSRTSTRTVRTGRTRTAVGASPR